MSDNNDARTGDVARYHPSVMYVRDTNPADPRRPYVPMTTSMLGGGTGTGGGTASPEATQTYPGETLAVGAGQHSLTVPQGANRARIEVTSGSVRWAYGAAGPQTNLLEVGDSVTVEGAQLAALRLIQGELGGATAWVDYWRMG